MPKGFAIKAISFLLFLLFWFYSIGFSYLLYLNLNERSILDGLKAALFQDFRDEILSTPEFQQISFVEIRQLCDYAVNEGVNVTDFISSYEEFQGIDGNLLCQKVRNGEINSKEEVLRFAFYSLFDVKIGVMITPILNEIRSVFIPALVFYVLLFLVSFAFAFLTGKEFKILKWGIFAVITILLSLTSSIVVETVLSSVFTIKDQFPSTYNFTLSLITEMLVFSFWFSFFSLLLPSLGGVLRGFLGGGLKKFKL